MFKNFKLLVLLIIIIFFIACFGREIEYEGPYPELFTVAINSIIGLRGYNTRVIGGRPPSIGIREEDSHGRRLFFYDEDLESPIYLIIQKVEGNYAYFYPHYNFVFSHRNIGELKEVNSWNQEMSDRSEFVRVRIVRRKEEGPISDDKLVEVFQLLFPERDIDRRSILFRTIFFRTDNYGRFIYSFENRIILFQPDHSFDIETGKIILSNFPNSQTELRLFMEENGWDTPFYE